MWLLELFPKKNVGYNVSHSLFHPNPPLLLFFSPTCTWTFSLTGHQVSEVIAEPILRVSDGKSTTGKKTSLSLMNREANLNDDFIKVTVRFKNGSRQTDFHAAISEVHEVKQRNEIHSSPVNIMILVFDGTSAAHFQRMLPKTYSFLKDELDSVIFRGYSIVGESTTPAMSALLTGNSVGNNCQKFKEGRRGKGDAGEIDEWPFIFKELKKLGFATMWSEDQPNLGNLPRIFKRGVYFGFVLSQLKSKFQPCMQT